MAFISANFDVSISCSSIFVFMIYTIIKPFLGRVAISISILYGFVFKSFLGRVVTFISIYIV